METVCVAWVDSASYSAWADIEDMKIEPITSETTGYLIKETEEYLVISHTLNVDKTQVAGYIVIPKSCVIKMFEILKEDKRMETIRLSSVIKIWDVLHVKNTGDLGYSDLEKAIEKTGCQIVNDVIKEQPKE